MQTPIGFDPILGDFVENILGDFVENILGDFVENIDDFQFGLEVSDQAHTMVENIVPGEPLGPLLELDVPTLGAPPEDIGRPDNSNVKATPVLPTHAADAADGAFLLAFPAAPEQQSGETSNFTGLDNQAHGHQVAYDQNSIDISSLANAKPEGGGGGSGSGGKKPPVQDTPTSAVSFYTVTLGDADIYENDVLIEDNYNIELQFYGDSSLWGGSLVSGDWVGGLFDAFLGAAEYLTSIITKGYASDVYDGPYADFENGLELTSKESDDIVIEAYLADIDGVGGILGRAGSYDQPDIDNDGVLEGLPTAGLMEFDSSDALNLLDGATQGGLWNDTVLHEMIHVLGFGTLWDFEAEDTLSWETDFGATTLVGTTLYVDDQGTNKPTDDLRGYMYNGTNGNDEVATSAGGWFLGTNLSGESEYAAIVESSGGAGTARGHWSEAFYDNEIMTGFINTLNDGVNEGANYMADFTVAALADLGYELASANYDAMAAAGTHFLNTGEVLDWSEPMFLA